MSFALRKSTVAQYCLDGIAPARLADADMYLKVSVPIACAMAMLLQVALDLDQLVHPQSISLPSNRLCAPLPTGRS